MLAARFILRIRAYTERTGHGGRTEEVSTFHASRPGGGGQGTSLVDEFGHDPVGHVAVDPEKDSESGVESEAKSDQMVHEPVAGPSTSSTSVPSSE